jgi:GNAT superfamily N-acetyltransferase
VISTLVIRQIRASEAARLRAIRLQALSDSPEAFGSTLAQTQAWPSQYWHDRAAQAAAGVENILFVAEENVVWVGLVGGVLENQDGKSAELISMWVNPTYRRAGVGFQLVERVVKWARHHGARRVALWVTQHNASAISLYARCGFASSGETQVLPSNPALLEQRMVLHL